MPDFSIQTINVKSILRDMVWLANHELTEMQINTYTHGTSDEEVDI